MAGASCKRVMRIAHGSEYEFRVEGLNNCVVEFSNGGDECLIGSVDELADQREVTLGPQHAPEIGEGLAAVGRQPHQPAVENPAP